MCIFQKQSNSHDESRDLLATTVVKNAIYACQDDNPTHAVSWWYYARIKLMTSWEMVIREISNYSSCVSDLIWNMHIGRAGVYNQLHTAAEVVLKSRVISY